MAVQSPEIIPAFESEIFIGPPPEVTFPAIELNLIEIEPLPLVISLTTELFVIKIFPPCEEIKPVCA